MRSFKCFHSGNPLCGAALDLYANYAAISFQHKIDLIIAVPPVAHGVAIAVLVIDQVCTDRSFHPSTPGLWLPSKAVEFFRVLRREQGGVVNLELGT